MALSVDIAIDNRSGIAVDLTILDAAKAYIEKTLKAEGVTVPCEVSFSLVTPDEIKALNTEYRGIERETDVLSFPMLELPEESNQLTEEGIFPLMLGDIIISTTQAKKQAEEYGNTLEREICYLTVHSVLHLLGYDHIKEDEKRKMRIREKEIMGDN